MYSPDYSNLVGIVVGMLVLGCIVVWLLSKVIERFARGLSGWWGDESEKNRDEQTRSFCLRWFRYLDEKFFCETVYVPFYRIQGLACVFC